MAPAKKKDTGLSLASGGIAGAIEACCTWPMEYIKTQLQLMSNVKGGKPPPYNGILSGISYTVRTTGFLSLYRGLEVTLICSMPKAGIRFGGNQFFRNQMMGPDGKVSTFGSFVAGGCAGISEAVAVVTPQETIKTKLIDAKMGLVDGVKMILRTEGVGGLYKGLFSTCLKQSGNHGSRFMFMAEYKRVLTGDSEGKLKMYESFTGGMGAGLFSILTTAPFDVVKTRMQGLKSAEYSSTLDCFVQIATKEGPLQFYSGALARAARVVPGQGIIFMSYEFIQDAVSKATGIPA